LAPAGWAAKKVLWIHGLAGLALFPAKLAFGLLDYYSLALITFH
jgi:hypothetical protein